MGETQPASAAFQAGADGAELVGRDAEPRLPIAACARALRVSPATMRRYIHDHGVHLDAVRDGRTLRVAVSSVPALAQIRDLRARKFSRQDIDRLLATLSDETALAGLAPSPGETTPDDAVAKRLDALHRDIATMKEELRDSDVLVRQSLANILFLVEKCTRDIQYYASEERIASRERDLRLTEVESEYRRLSARGRKAKGVLASLMARYRLVLATAFSR
jgi:DNA-binding transcriptional MerR regulator